MSLLPIFLFLSSAVLNLLLAAQSARSWAKAEKISAEYLRKLRLWSERGFPEEAKTCELCGDVARHCCTVYRIGSKDQIWLCADHAKENTDQWERELSLGTEQADDE